MRTGRVLLAALAAAWFTLGSAPATAQEAEPAAETHDGWKFRVAPYLWLANIDATSTIGPMTIPFDVTFEELFDNLEFGGSLRAEASKGAWTLVADVTYLRVKNTVTPVASRVPDLPLVVTDSTSVGITFIAGLADLVLAYRIGDDTGSFTPVVEDRKLQAWEIYGGLRGNLQNIDISVMRGEPSLTREVDEHWVDPIIGVRFYTDMGRKWGALFRGDVGGFNVSSEIIYSLAGGVLWKVSKHVDVLAEYRYLYMDYFNDKSGDAAYGFKGNLHGLQVGLNFNIGG